MKQYEYLDKEKGNCEEQQEDINKDIYLQHLIKFRKLQNFLKMGSSNVKDDQIDLYMEVNQPYYLVGQHVQGCVYLNAKQTRPYENLVIRLTGQEHVYWTQGTHRRRKRLNNTIINYDSVFTLFDFKGTVNQGHYSFPFSFLLPNSMSGSFDFSDCCYIRYTLKTVMNHPNKEEENQEYQMYLNIMETPRVPFAAVTTKRTTSSKCCWCCMDYGNTTVNMKCDKNFAISGDTINIQVLVDNSQGKNEVQSGKLIFQEKRMVVSKGGTARYWTDQQTPLATINKVGPGQTQNFNFEVKIPPNMKNYTAIGTCTGRYFLVAVEAEMGCCAETIRAEVHIIVHTQTPDYHKQEKVQPPNGWNPHEYPKVVCNKMKPFVYKPLKGIRYRNLPNEMNLMENQIGGMEPNFEEEEGDESQEEMEGNNKKKGYNVY